MCNQAKLFFIILYIKSFISVLIFTEEGTKGDTWRNKQKVWFKQKTWCTFKFDAFWVWPNAYDSESKSVLT